MAESLNSFEVIEKAEASFWKQSMWILHKGFLDLVRSVWQEFVVGNDMMIVIQKLKWVKVALKSLNVYLVWVSLLLV